MSTYLHLVNTHAGTDIIACGLWAMECASMCESPHTRTSQKATKGEEKQKWSTCVLHAYAHTFKEGDTAIVLTSLEQVALPSANIELLLASPQHSDSKGARQAASWFIG